MVKKFLKERLGTIILFVIVIVFLIWGYFSIEEARSNAITYNEDYEAPEGDVDFTIPGEYGCNSGKGFGERISLEGYLR